MVRNPVHRTSFRACTFYRNTRDGIPGRWRIRKEIAGGNAQWGGEPTEEAPKVSKIDQVRQGNPQRGK
jgi:hypothetical protein